MKKSLISFLVVLFLFFIPATVYLMEYTSPIRATQSNILYNLPYPGILPDNPLYVFKATRDRLLEWATRDNLKKAELYLLFSDKGTAMSLQLAKKGKEKQAVDTMQKAEEYFNKIPKLLSDAKKQGSGSSSEFIDNLKLSNAKHREVLDTYLKDFPQGSNDSINGVVKINEEIRNRLQKI